MWAGVILVASIVLIPFAHDAVVVAGEDSKDEAWFKNQSGPRVDPPWREAMFANNELGRFRLSSDDVVRDDAGVYLVPSWVERLEPDGTWARRECITRWRRDGFDDWCLESRLIEGELVQRLDWRYPPSTWHSNRMWLR